MITKKQKTFNVRVPVELWKFLKRLSMEKEVSMNSLIIESLAKMKKKYEKLLTSNDTMA